MSGQPIIHFVVSVGTSITGNFKKHENSQLCLGHPDDILKKGKFEKTHQSKIDKLYKKEYHGAEQSSIDKVLVEALPKGYGLKNCCFHFITTDTDDGKTCTAHLMYNVYNEAEQATYYIPEGLGNADNKDFASKGLPSLLEKLAEILDKIEEHNKKAIIIPTGGYKAIIPYLTIAGILYHQPAYYIYENSDQLLKLPAPPLGVNSTDFRTALVLLNNIIGLDEQQAEPYYKALKEDFRNLVYLDDTQKYKYNAFGIRLNKLFHDQPASPVIAQAVGNTLFPRLKCYTPLFFKMTHLGESVWIGDKAIEMADHARYHHVNLLSYADLFFCPLYNEHNNFFSKEELFLFLGVVYFHDCGHSRCIIQIESDNGDQPQVVPLLPTEIRTFHNVLGYQRIRDKNFQESLSRQSVDLDEEVYENIATLSLYHRKKMPLRKNCYHSPDGTVVRNLNSRNFSFKNESIKGKRAELMMALFRVIDGMDKQVARAGEANEIAMKAESVLADLPYLWQRVLRLENALPCSLKTEIDTELGTIFKDYKNAEKSDSTTKESKCCKGYKKNGCVFPEVKQQEQLKETSIFFELKKRLLDQNKKFFPVAWEYLDARVRFFFLSLQPTYYYSDLLLKMPQVEHSFENENHHFIINYEKNNDDNEHQRRIKSVWEKIKEWVQDNMPENKVERNILNAELSEPENIVAGIREEYCRKESQEVAEILWDNNITIEFRCAGNRVSCCRKEL